MCSIYDLKCDLSTYLTWLALLIKRLPLWPFWSTDLKEGSAQTALAVPTLWGVSWAGARDLLTSLDLLPSCLTTPRVRSSTISVLPGISQTLGRLKCLHAAHSSWRKRIFHVDIAEEQKGHYLLGNMITGVVSSHFISTLKYDISLCRKKSWINPHLDPYSLSVPQEGSRVAQAHRGGRWPVHCEPGSWEKRASYSEAVKYSSGLILPQSTQIRNGLIFSWE